MRLFVSVYHGRQLHRGSAERGTATGERVEGHCQPPPEPGETRRLRVEMDRRSFAYYDVDRGDWTVSPGEFEILVGRSSEVIELRRKLTFTR